jgi:hypothetical protein
MRVLAAIVVLACLSASARAEDLPPERSTNVALMLPLGVTALGVVLVGFGSDKQDSGDKALLGIGAVALIAGPPLGRLYARDVSWFGLGMEAGGVLLMATAATGTEGANGLAIMGIGVYSVGALYQIISAPGVVYRSNQRRVMLVPTSNANGAGLSLAGAF